MIIFFLLWNRFWPSWQQCFQPCWGSDVRFSQKLFYPQPPSWVACTLLGKLIVLNFYKLTIYEASTCVELCHQLFVTIFCAKFSDFSTVLW